MHLPQKGDASLIKNINQQIILNLIRSKRLISGAELSKITKLQFRRAVAKPDRKQLALQQTDE